MTGAGLLQLSSITAGYGKARVLSSVSIGIGAGECVALLGRNGVGKTTTMRTIVGLTTLSAGTIQWDGQSIANWAPDRIARSGIALVPEDRRIFAELTVRENLQVARSGSEWTVEQVLDLFPELKPHLARMGGYLSGGQQQMLTIARALMTSPRLMLLDEPSEGLAPVVVDRLLEAVLKLKQLGKTLLLAEQSLWFSLEVADRVYVMDRGRIVLENGAAEIKSNPTLANQHLTV
ncbi:MAG: ABC transporter ATP-binding protein [Hyphomicrobium aestuarii]|nr:ABC transporter ATP-binding protein [Hyphomicrobium aestuarii]